MELVSPKNASHIYFMFSKAAGEFHTSRLVLYMTSLCIKKMKGNIQLIQSGEPTTFKVTVPIALADEKINLI